MFDHDQKIQQAADWIRQADSLLITAGAGMGVDSGLPDFRGPQGFWRAYPGLRSERIEFQDIANPRAFIQTPKLAWGFYGHRLNLYRTTVPHRGFDILLKLGNEMRNGYFVFTSNVDGQFQKAGFDSSRIVECHGSIHSLQCIEPCTSSIWSADEIAVEVDEPTCTAQSALPQCPRCGQLARPNILMFNDWGWLSDQTDLQHQCFQHWLKTCTHVAVIEIGAGTAIPSVRIQGESIRAPLIRINPTQHETQGPNAIGIKAGALETLDRLRKIL
ncbi:MAG: SIR2 family NAD-dependent protein deacylase [Burkholderiaceae bacterium]